MRQFPEASSLRSSAAKDMQGNELQRDESSSASQNDFARKGCLAAISGACAGTFRGLITWACDVLGPSGDLDA